MKINKLIIILLTLIIAYSCQQEKKNSKHVSWINFEWQGDSIGNRYFDKLAMFVPFKIENIPYKFTAQLDLGAPSTMVYGNSFSPLLKEYPNIASKLDTLNKNYVIQGRKMGGFKDISFYLDTVEFKHQNVAFFENFGDNYQVNDLKSDTILHIGTIGSNLFDNKILIIDFKNQKIAILDTLPNTLNKELTEIVIEKGRIKVPVTINGEKKYVIYDTGTSFATLFLSTNNWNEYRDTTSKLDTIMATAWGVKYPILTSKTNVQIKIGNKIFEPKTIMANSLKPYYEFYKKENIIGLMGNKMFYNQTLVIDFKNKKFGIINNRQLTQHIRNGG